jgi:ABC-type sugar transport system substrate-binding protein
MARIDPRDAPSIIELDPRELLDTMSRFRDGHMTRRQFMTRTAAMGLSLTSIGMLLAACGSSTATGTPVPTAPPVTGATPTAAGPAPTPGSSAAPAGGGGMVGFNQPYLSAAVAVPLYNGAAAEAQKRGYQLLKSAVQNAQLDLQLAEVNQWIALGIKGMTILPVDPNAFGPVITKAHAAGVKSVGGYDGHIPGEDTWLGFDQDQGAGLVASAATNYIQSTLGGKAFIAGLIDNTLPQSKLRVDDCIQLILDQNPLSKLVDKETAVLAADALKATQVILQAHPETNMIICLADDGSGGAAQACKLAGRKPTDTWIAGYDGGKQMLAGMISGDIFGCDAALPLLDIGAHAVDLPCNVIEGVKPNIWIAPYEVLTNTDTDKLKTLLAVYP